MGGVLGPFDSFLALRGVKTLALRIRQRACDSALEIARWLEAHPAIERVIYPGLESHPQHDLADVRWSAASAGSSRRISRAAWPRPAGCWSARACSRSRKVWAGSKA
ncbi:PLP-dependent transferase [Caulobacter segnis]